MADELIVEFQGVSKIYDAEGSGATTAIRDISFEVANKPGRGEIVSLLGPSGCGKSTILRLIAGLRPQFPPTTGTVKVMGKPIKARPGPRHGFSGLHFFRQPHRAGQYRLRTGVRRRIARG